MNGELSNTEDRGERSASEGGTTCNSLVLVEGETKGLSAEESLDSLLDSGDTGGTSNKLDGVDLVDGKAGLAQSLLERAGESGQEVVGELLESLTLERGGSINIVHDRFNVQWRLSVGGKNLLQTLTSGSQTEDSLGVGHDINLVFCLELLSKVLNKRVVEVTATEVSVVGGRFDGQLTLGEADDSNRVVGVTDIDETDMTGSLGGLGQVGLGDTVTEGDGGGVVDQTEGVEAGNLGSIVKRSSLNVSVPTWNGNNNVGDSLLELDSGGIPQFTEVGGDELGVRESGRLAKVVDLVR